MPNRDVHLPVSRIFGALVAGGMAHGEEMSVILCRTLGGILGGHIGGLMPDIIDSPRNGPNHRSIGHGVFPLGLIFLVGADKLVVFRQSLKQQAKRAKDEENTVLWFFLESTIGMIDGFLAGYLAHLALDARTPRGLPIIS